MKFKSQKEDRVAATLLLVGRFARILKSEEHIIPPSGKFIVHLINNFKFLCNLKFLNYVLYVNKYGSRSYKLFLVRLGCYFTQSDNN